MLSSNIFNAHVPLSLRVGPFSSHRAIDLHIYTDVNGHYVHELINFHAQQYMPSLLSVTKFTEDQLEQARLVVIEGQATERYDKPYGDCWRSGLSRCTVQLLQDINTRRAIILFNDEYPQPTCLSSVQFMVRSNRLEMIANFRSWELQDYAKYDMCLLLAMAQEMQRHLSAKKVELGTLHINAGSAHILISG